MLLEQHLQDLNYEIVGLKGSKYSNNNILECVGKENELDISKRMVKVKEVFFVKKYELAQLVDAPLNYLKYSYFQTKENPELSNKY